MSSEYEIYTDGKNGNEHKFIVIADCDVIDRGIGAYEFW